MGDHAPGAVLNSHFGIGEIPSAVLSQGVQRAITEQAAEALLIYPLMAGKVLTFAVLKKIVICHDAPTPLSSRFQIESGGLLVYNTIRFSSREKRVFYFGLSGYCN